MKFNDMPYERADFSQFEKKIQQLMEEFSKAQTGEGQFQIHQVYYKVTDEFFTMSTIAYIRHGADLQDEFYNKEQDYYDEIMPQVSNLLTAYEKQIFESPFRDFLEKKIGKVAFKNIEIGMKAVDEKLIPLMQEENKLTTEYNKLLGGAKIEWNGDILNLSLLRKYMTDPDRMIRRRAHEKASEFYKSHVQEMDDYYDKLVKNRTEQAHMLGYENYLELGYYRMQRNCYDKEMTKKFREQVKKDLVPFAEKLHNRRRERLGLSQLAYYDADMYFTQGNPAPIGTPEEILQAGQKMYAQLSPETKEFFDFMKINELFDVLGRKNKKTGGYMTYIPKYHAPFIFANFNGTSGDVDVITHECGHAFQGYVCGTDPIREHRDITMETAEIHSMAMEFFTEPWMDLFFGDRTQDYITMHIESAVLFIPYGCMIDEFQHIVYENPGMTPKERNYAFRELERVYKPHLNYTENEFLEEGHYWQRQHHIYDSPLYYIDYSLAQICALQYKVMMGEDYKKAWGSYLKLCQLSASDFYTGLLEQVGLKSPFADGSIQNIVTKLENKVLKW